MARAEAVRRDAQALLDGERFDAVEAQAQRIEALARRGKLQVAWDARKQSVAALEGPLDNEGVPTARPVGKKAVEALARFREALADGDVNRLDAVGRDLVEQAGSVGEGGARAKPGTVPTLNPAARELNRRYHPDALGRYDRAVAAYEEAKARRNRGDAARHAAEAARIHERLLRPVSTKGGRRVAVMGAAAAVLVAALATVAYFVFGGGEEQATVALLSAVGEAQVAELSRDGQPVTDLFQDDLTVPESGVRWELVPGKYRLRTDDGREVDFEVPTATAVLIPGAGIDPTAELLEELDFASLVGTDGG